MNIPNKELKFVFIKSSGPGGQNINKVSTGVQLSFDIKNSPSLNEKVKRRLLILGGKKVTKDGILNIESKRFRTQEKNRQDAIKRLTALINEAKKIKKKRIKTSPTNSSVEARIEYKKRRAQTKKLRKRIKNVFQ